MAFNMPGNELAPIMTAMALDDVFQRDLSPDFRPLNAHYMIKLGNLHEAHMARGGFEPYANMYQMVYYLVKAQWSLIVVPDFGFSLIRDDVGLRSVKRKLVSREDALARIFDILTKQNALLRAAIEPGVSFKHQRLDKKIEDFVKAVYRSARECCPDHDVQILSHHDNDFSPLAEILHDDTHVKIFVQDIDAPLVRWLFKELEINLHRPGKEPLTCDDEGRWIGEWRMDDMADYLGDLML